MTAGASVVAERAGDRTRCTSLVSAPPLTLRATPDGLYLVASGAGPVGGDSLALDVTVGPGAGLDVRSAAAALALPGPKGEPSAMTVDVEVGPGAALTWEPEPTVLVAGCDHRATATIHLAPDARLLWREAIVLGRHAEASGSLLQRLAVDVGDRPLLRNEVAVGPGWPGAAGPAGAGDARAVGTLLAVGIDARIDAAVDLPGARASVVRLDDRSTLVTVVAVDAARVLAVLRTAAAAHQRSGTTRSPVAWFT